MNASKLIDQKIASLADWRGEKLDAIRTLIRDVHPDIIEEWKWKGTPVWSLDGLICTGETYKNVVKMTFAKGAALKDPARLFNASLEGNQRRAIDFDEGAPINEQALKALIRAAIALNQTAPAKRKPDATSTLSGYLPGTKQPAAKRAPAKQPAEKRATAKQPAAKKKPATR